MAGRARRTRSEREPALPPYRPQLAKLVDAAPEGDRWLHEMKYDGYRVGCRIEHGVVALESRNGQDLTRAFPEVVEAASALAVERALLDGEVAILLPDGRTSFQALQNIGSGSSRRGLAYFVFDLLHLDGDDLGALPLEARKQKLEALVARAGNEKVLRYAAHVVGNGPRVAARACELGAEGIVSKRRDGPYRRGRTDDWRKIKCFLRQEFVVGGFTDPGGSRTGLGSLLIGYHDEQGRLRFAGKVGTGPGLTAARWEELRHDLDALERAACPFEPAPPSAIARRSHWVKPVRIAEVTFTEWTAAGQIRHPSLVGFRTDKKAREVTRETAAHVDAAAAEAARDRKTSSSKTHAPAKRGRAGARAVVAGVSITTPERPVYPALSFSKLDLAAYFAQVAEAMLPHVRDRPLTLVRCEHGVERHDALRTECMFLRHEPGFHRWAAPSIRRVAIVEQRKIGEYLVVDSRAALVGIAQGDILELHAWNSTTAHVEQPDRFVFDLDPGEDVAWADVIAAAHLVRERLESIGLLSWPKLTGGRGLHVVAPFEPELDWTASYKVARAIGAAVVRAQPDTFTLASGKQHRRGKILLDVKRNHRAAVAVCAYSPRAHPSGAVSVPVSWDELSPAVRSDHYTVRSVLERLARLREDPWKGYGARRPRLT